MRYINIEEIAARWNLSVRSVRNYCASGRIEGAKIEAGKWLVPENAVKPIRKIRSNKIPNSIAKRLVFEMEHKLTGGLYHILQIDFTYNSNHIEGSRLTHDQTRYIFETNTIGLSEEALPVDDIIETANHFRCIDFIIKNYNKQLTESFIKELHSMLKAGTSDSRKGWFAVGDYKKLANEVGGLNTTLPSDVGEAMRRLLEEYKSQESKTLESLLDFHYKFEIIHPFQDGNGRIGRLILFKECLKHGILPFVIEENLKLFYYRGLNEWKKEHGYLLGTCETEQDKFKRLVEYFRNK
ncbi:MAG: Fic family protein [Phascolarctobacterium sp.]|nr:Fic family protein [Phascolarctobacterium sp.]